MGIIVDKLDCLMTSDRFTISGTISGGLPNLPSANCFAQALACWKIHMPGALSIPPWNTELEHMDGTWVNMIYPKNP